MLSIRVARLSVVVCLFSILVSAIGSAQPPEGSRGGFGGGRGFGGRRGGFNIDRATLLRSDEVRTELGIEEAQAATIDAALEAYLEERGSSPKQDPGALAKMTEEERIAVFEKLLKDREERRKKTDEVLGALLEPEQAARLDQISLQAKLKFAIFATLKSEELKSKLSLTDEQVSKLDDAEKTAMLEMQTMSQGLRGGGERGGIEIQDKFAAARRKSEEAAMAILTVDQAAIVNEIKGPEFDIDMRSILGRRGGFGGPPGGGDRKPSGDRGKDGGRGTRPPVE